MIDRYVLPLQKRILQPVASRVAKHGVHADVISLSGFAVGLSAVPLLAFDLYREALLAILLNRLFDGLDGAVARAVGPTDRGAFIDIAFDFFFYAAVPVGFAIADPAVNALPAAILVASFMGTGSSFLAFAIIAAKRGLTAADYPQKGIYYLGGLAEGAETIAVFVAMCLWPNHFPLIAFSYAAICLITTVTRWRQGWVAFTQKDFGSDVRI